MRTVRKDIVNLFRSSPVPSNAHYEKQIVLQSRTISNLLREKKRLKFLAEIEFSGFSQWGEDGIIDWLIDRLPGMPETFVEFGVQDYRESNTRLLLYLRNWRGLVMDGSCRNIADIKQQDISWRFDLEAQCAFIDRDNINNLIYSAGISGEIGLLSVDLDGNDYWVWKAIDVVNPVIVVCEYNAVFGDAQRISVPYRPDFQRTIAHHSNLYFGASLPSLIDLGNQKGYVYIGSNSNGCNAFFVREDRASEIVQVIDEVKSFPSRFRESRDAAGKLTYVRGEKRIEIIRHLPVFDFESQSIKQLMDIYPLYSPKWSG